MNINFGARMVLKVPTEALKKVSQEKQNQIVSVNQGYVRYYADVDEGQLIVTNDGTITSDRTNMMHVEYAIQMLAGGNKALEKELSQDLGKSFASRDLYVPATPAEGLFSNV